MRTTTRTPPPGDGVDVAHAEDHAGELGLEDGGDDGKEHGRILSSLASLVHEENHALAAALGEAQARAAALEEERDRLQAARRDERETQARHAQDIQAAADLKLSKLYSSLRVGHLDGERE